MTGCGTGRRSTAGRTRAFDLADYTLAGVPVLGPADADRYLTENYGDWRTPVTEFNCTTGTPNLVISRTFRSVALFLTRLAHFAHGDPAEYAEAARHPRRRRHAARRRRRAAPRRATSDAGYRERCAECAVSSPRRPDRRRPPPTTPNRGHRVDQPDRGGGPVAEILWTLVQRDLRVRYSRSVLGYVWTVLDPLLMASVYFVVFTYIFKADGRVADTPYFLYLRRGLLAVAVVHRARSPTRPRA